MQSVTPNVSEHRGFTLRRGFTLIELLLVISIIGVLAAVVIVAINPSRQFAQARNAERRSDVKNILEAVQQYAIDNKGNPPTGVDATWRMLGTATTTCDVTCGGGSGGGPVTVSLAPTADTYINEGSPATNYGADVTLWTDPWQAGNAKRSLISFDLSSIPVGATVTAADLYLLEANTQGTARTIAAHRITQTWAEGTATWANSAAAYDATPTDAISVDWAGSVPTWDAWNVLADVQDIVNGIDTNNGWLFKDTAEGTPQYYWQFHSREAAVNNRPYLSVTYTSGITTAGSCLDISPNLVSTYLPSIPEDPQSGSAAKTFYALQVGSDSRLSVRACTPEVGETIAVER